MLEFEGIKADFRNGTTSSMAGGTQECSRWGVGPPRWMLTVVEWRDLWAWRQW